MELSTSLPIYKLKLINFKQSAEYKSLLMFNHILLNTILLNTYNKLKFLIFNDFGIAAEILTKYKHQLLLVSEFETDYYYLPDEFKVLFKYLDWKNSILQLNFTPNYIIDYELSLTPENIDLYLLFLKKYKYPNLILLINSIELFIDRFSEFYIINYELINSIKNKLLTKSIKIPNLNNLLMCERKTCPE